MSKNELSRELEDALKLMDYLEYLNKKREQEIQKFYNSFKYKVEEFDIRGVIIYQVYFNSFEDLVEFYYKEIETNRIERCRIINQRENLILSDVSRFITLEKLETIKGE